MKHGPPQIAREEMGLASRIAQHLDGRVATARPHNPSPRVTRRPTQVESSVAFDGQPILGPGEKKS